MPYIKATVGNERKAFVILKSIPNIGENLSPHEVVDDIVEIRIEDDLRQNRNPNYFNFYIVMLVSKTNLVRFEYIATPKKNAPNLFIKEKHPTIEKLREYGYLYEGMTPLTLEEAISHWIHDGFSVLRLYEDNTEGYAESATDFIDHWERGGMLGIEIKVKTE